MKKSPASIAAAPGGVPLREMAGLILRPTPGPSPLRRPES